jgi:hypothetical protein
MKEENKLVSKKMESQVSKIKEYSHSELIDMANIYHKSKLAPPHLQTPESIYIAFRWALALNIDPFLGLRDIFVIENIPTIRTEAAIALVEASGFCEYIEQSFLGQPFDDNFTAICKVKRKGRKEHISTFAVKDAKIAKLWGKKTKDGKDTVWILYPKRMLMYRAVGFAIRDVFPDVLRGAKLYEEVINYPDFQILEDKSNSEEIDVKVKSETKNKKGISKLIDLMDEEPPLM